MWKWATIAFMLVTFAVLSSDIAAQDPIPMGTQTMQRTAPAVSASDYNYSELLSNIVMALGAGVLAYVPFLVRSGIHQTIGLVARRVGLNEEVAAKQVEALFADRIERGLEHAVRYGVGEVRDLIDTSDRFTTQNNIVGSALKYMNARLPEAIDHFGLGPQADTMRGGPDQSDLAAMIRARIRDQDIEEATGPAKENNGQVRQNRTGDPSMRAGPGARGRDDTG